METCQYARASNESSSSVSEKSARSRVCALEAQLR